jgi:hypothetical protein
MILLQLLNDGTKSVKKISEGLVMVDPSVIVGVDKNLSFRIVTESLDGRWSTSLSRDRTWKKSL